MKYLSAAVFGEKMDTRKLDDCSQDKDEANGDEIIQGSRIRHFRQVIPVVDAQEAHGENSRYTWKETGRLY